MSKKAKRVKIYVRDKKRCYVCGISLSFNKLTLDHVVPKTDGGSGKIINLKACCRKCNMIKGKCESIINSRVEKGGSISDRQNITICLSYSYFKEILIKEQNSCSR